jgi:hypothetical protein
MCNAAAWNMSNIKYIFYVFQICNMEVVQNFEVTFDSISSQVFAVKTIQIMVLWVAIEILEEHVAAVIRVAVLCSA